MNSAQIRAMQDGRKRSARERERDSIYRVRAYTKWLKAGSNLRTMPDLPTDADYALARRREEQ